MGKRKIEKAKEKLQKLIDEIDNDENQDGFLAEHSCIFILDDLREIMEILEGKKK